MYRNLLDRAFRKVLCTAVLVHVFCSSDEDSRDMATSELRAPLHFERRAFES